MIPDTPQTLLRKIAEYADGDDAAEWSRFVELYEPVVRQYAAMRGDSAADDADDIVQEIFVRLVEVLRGGEYKKEKGRFRNYLAAMVRRLLINIARKVRPSVQCLFYHTRLDATRWSPELGAVRRRV